MLSGGAVASKVLLAGLFQPLSLTRKVPGAKGLDSLVVAMWSVDTLQKVCKPHAIKGSHAKYTRNLSKSVTKKHK